jgi:hypothetical protein
MSDLVQGLWNSVLGKNFFIDARLGMNKILFPTYQNGETINRRPTPRPALSTELPH